MELIDKSAVVAEIERRIKEIDLFGTYLSPKGVLINLLCHLNSIEVKENGLVEELDYDDYMTFFKEYPEYNNGDWGFDETWAFAQYCYKLGLKAQKGGEE